MASGLHFIALLCLTSGLWMEANVSIIWCCESCPSGWAQIGTRCFMFNFQERDWADAELACIKLGGNLASLRSAYDYKVAREIVKRATGRDKPIWIGGHDAVKEGVWEWSDGSKFDFTGWAKAEPNNAGKGEHCMEMNFKEHDYVNDMKCEEKRSFLCSTDPTSQQLSLTNKTNDIFLILDHVGASCVTCPTDWKEFDGHCFLFSLGPKGWADAEADCIAHGGNLASVHGSDQYNFLKEIIKSVTGADTQTWIGGHDAVKEGVWMWSDGTQFKFDLWGPGEPSSSRGEHCLELNYLGKPNDGQCQLKKPFICQL
ncbi:C-type mannose receptor 2-like [Pempheris klunzingeri]|uniref:C-type mannose receptor 2-like n=1 Tax=Pempheris klunzingeri TaxID=3127111 RepID=UPI00397F1DDB